MKAYLTLKNISKNFNGFYALKNISLNIYPGEVHCIAGQNGCGKSTVIKVISGVHKPDKDGLIEVNNKKYSSLTPIQSVREGIQVIYQDLSLFPNLTVAENIMINTYHDHWIRNDKYMVEKSIAILHSIGSSIEPTTIVSNLTISQCQLVAIARTLAEDAKLIIMDEPTASLTKNEVSFLISIVKKLKGQGIAIIFVSHKLDEVMEISDRFSVLKDGELLGTYPVEDITIDKLSYLMTGKNITFERLISQHSDEVVLECKNLFKKNQFSNINFSVKKGEVFAITGLLGSGRTELCLSLFGLNPVDAGDIYIEDKKVNFKNNRAAIEAGVGYVSEDRMGTGLVMDQPISDNIISTKLSTFQPKLKLFQRQKAEELVTRLINQLNIKIGHHFDSVNTLSGGNAQRVSIAKWLTISPKILILDSPTIGVDIANKSGIYSVIRQLSEQGVAIILITDEAEEAINNSHVIAVMSHGKITSKLITKNTSTNKVLEAIND